MVVYAEWNEDENSVYCTFFIDEDAYPDIARGVRQGYLTDVSMGTSVAEGECSVCKNKALVERDWCDCLKKYKGRKHPDNGKHVYEINRGLKFIELSIVGDGAFDTCEIKAIMEVDELLTHVDGLNEKVANIQSNLTLAVIEAPDEPLERIAYENCIRQISSCTSSIVKVAQQAGNLVGGQLLSLDNANQNATVSNILNYLGISGQHGLNVLDLMNLALNFLEVAVMNLFSRKDNIDLNHVGKITKAMAELQSTMQDLIDDGMANAPGGSNSVPAPTNVPTESSVGQVIAPGGQGQAGQQPVSAPPAQTQSLDLDDHPFNNDEIKLSKTKNMLEKLANLIDLLGNKEKSLNNNNIQNGGNNLMSFAKNFTHNFNEEKNIYEIESGNYKVVLSSNGKASGYIDNHKTSYDPTVTQEESSLIEKGDLRTAAESILNRHMKIATKIFEAPSIAQIIDENNADGDKVIVKPMETLLKEDHIYNKNDNAAMRTLQERTESRRHEVKGPIEKRLGEEGWNARRGTQTKTYEEILDTIILPRGEYEEVYEELLQEKRIFKNRKAVDNVEKVITALALAAISTGMTPDEMIDGAQNVADSGPDLITKAKMAKDIGSDVPGADDDATMAAASALSDQVDDTTSSGDLHSGLKSALEQLETATKALTNAVESLAGDSVVNPKIDDADPTDTEQVGADLATKADNEDPDVSETDVKSGVSSIANTADDLGIGTDDVLNSTSGMNEGDLQRQIELNKAPTLSAVRAKNMQRIAFYGFNRRASKKDILRTLIGHLADYAKDYDLRSKDLARVICSFNDAPSISRKLAAQALEEKRSQINVEKQTIVSKKTEEFEISEPTTITREAKKAKLMEKFAQLAPGLVPGGAPGAGSGPPAPAGVTPGAPGTESAAPAGPELDPTLGGPDAMPAAPAGDALGGDMDKGADDSQNHSAVSPGVKKPWGTVCPQCQSSDLDVAGGQGKCNSCGANLTYEFSVKVTPPDKSESYKGNLDPKSFKDSEGGLGDADGAGMGGDVSDIGLGAATAPQPAPPIPSAPGAGVPMTGTESGSPVTAGLDVRMFRISYTTDPDVFIKTAGNIRAAGTVCPACTSVDVEKSDHQSKCNDCDTLFITTIKPNANDARLLDTSITWMIN